MNKFKALGFENKLFLAPLAGITDRSFRTLCQKQGASLVYSEMISAKGLVYQDRGTERLLKIGDDENRVGFQLFGSEPEIMARAVVMLEERKNVLIDVNMGCPVPKIVRNGEGSALLKNPELIYKIIRAMVVETDKPITAKIRIGWDDSSLNYLETSRAIQEAGADAIAVHGRTRTQMYTGKSDREAIKEIKQNLSIPVIGNGDVMSYSDAEKMIEETGCDYVMIARGALGNPWIFNQNVDGKIPLQDRVSAMKEHLDMLIQDKGERVAVCEMRKHTGWYLKGISGVSKIRNQINSVSNRDEYLKLLEILIFNGF